MKSTDMPDFYQPLTPGVINTLTQGELIAYIRELERARSLWDARIRLCEEREFMYKRFVNDMAILLAQTFQQEHDAVSANATQATAMIESIKKCLQKLDDEK